ncbi:unnamed protein product [Didymodactylos carnosus]|uniref:Uncharacterized protein n=1 Tax=Didymodactylos carnosus TaxID=1234261 RepID=A0A814UKG0_9BILA|nr:unnamed protein product [Didymodactylos carnosus]CAF3939252.1 unnamed protein product [Didymodactylos carnosus]
MSGRTPSFILVGLIIILFLLGMYYMSCSSKNNELRINLEEFEERLRTLTMKNGDYERKIENINIRKREIEEEKAALQRQLEKKDIETNDLNTRLNQKTAELHSLTSEKQILDNKLRDYKTLNESLSSKETFIKQLTDQLDEYKRTKDSLDGELAKLRHEVEEYKKQKGTNNEQQQPVGQVQADNQQTLQRNSTIRGQPPLVSHQQHLSNDTAKENNNSILAGPLAEKLRNLTKRILPSADNSDRNNRTDQQVNNSNNNNNPQNVLPPPLANPAQQAERVGHIESQQLPPHLSSQNISQQQQETQNQISNRKDNRLRDSFQKPHPFDFPISVIMVSYKKYLFVPFVDNLIV